MRWPVFVAALAVFAASNAAFAQMPHEHHQPAETCAIYARLRGHRIPSVRAGRCFVGRRAVNNQSSWRSRSIWTTHSARPS